MRPLKQAWRWIGLTRTTTWLLAAMALAAALGSLLPQMPEVTSDAGGLLPRVLARAGLHGLARSPWLWLATIALVASLVACTARRWRAIRRSATLVTHLAPIALAFGYALTVFGGWDERVWLDVAGSGPALEHAPELSVGSPSWRLEVRPDGSPSAYAAELAVARQGQPICTGEARPNHPLHCAGIELVLTGYRNADRAQAPATQVEILASRDPGYRLAIGAAALLAAGASVSLLWPRRPSAPCP